jgi:hypothetical protein
MVGQINSAMDEVRIITEQNSANSEESASVAEELSGQAKELESMVRTFSLSQTSLSGRRPNVEPGTVKKDPVPLSRHDLRIGDLSLGMREPVPGNGKSLVKSTRPKRGFRPGINLPV